MTITSFDVFETTLHKTNRWLKELMEELDWQDQHAAYLAMRATLLALRDQLGAQLPMLIRGLYTRAGIRPASRSSCGTRRSLWPASPRSSTALALPVPSRSPGPFLEFGRARHERRDRGC
jgi:hypothetical protein